MIYRRIALDPQDERVYMDAYVPDAPREAKPAMLVIPGGGYANLAEDREGEPIALAFVARGVCAFVLHYRVGGAEDVYPTQLLDAWAVAIDPGQMTVDQLEEKLRLRPLPIIGRITHEQYILDVRTLMERDFAYIAQTAGEVVK